MGTVKGTLLKFTVVSVVIGVTAYWSLASNAPKITKAAGIDWYSSFPDALQEAKKTHKPILLLSMFGKLDEPMPCANARTLRATLFRTPEFQAMAKSDFVLAWEMVRAVPHVTIDLGDGKPITRTVRGNAVMYLCNEDGKVIDAFPGVYTAKDFIPALRESIKSLSSESTQAVLNFHRDRGQIVPAKGITAGKAVLESPTLNLMGAQPIRGAEPETADKRDPRRALFLSGAARLRDMSLTPTNVEETVYAVTGKPLKGRDPKEVVQQVLNVDSQNNMTYVRPVIHLYFASLDALPTPLEARDAILQSVLKIPYKDPYFGLKDVLLPGTQD